MYTLYLLLSLQSIHFSVEVPLKDFYSFGTEVGDSSLMPSDDQSSRILLSATFPFFGIGHNSVFVSGWLQHVIKYYTRFHGTLSNIDTL